MRSYTIVQVQYVCVYTRVDQVSALLRWAHVAFFWVERRGLRPNASNMPLVYTQTQLGRKCTKMQPSCIRWAKQKKWESRPNWRLYKYFQLTLKVSAMLFSRVSPRRNGPRIWSFPGTRSLNRETTRTHQNSVHCRRLRARWGSSNCQTLHHSLRTQCRCGNT